MGNIIKNIFNNHLYALSLYARQIAGTFVLFIIARYLSVYDFGLFSSYKNIAGFCLMFANMDFANYILVSSQANVKEVKLKISLFLLNAINIIILVSLGSIFFNLESHLLFILIVIRSFFDGTFFCLILPYFQSSKTFNTIAKINILYAIGVSIIAIISYIFKLSLLEFLILNIGLGLFNFIQCSYFAKINYLLVFNHIKRFYKMVDKSIYAYSFTCITYFLYAQIPALYVSTSIAKENAALFFAAFTISNIVFILVNAQNQKILPELIKSSYFDSKKIILQNIKLILSVLFILLIFFIFVGKILLQIIYGKSSYGDANIILIILLIGNMFIALGSIFGAYITVKGKQKYKIGMMLEASIVTIISLYVLKNLDILGASLAFMFAGIYAGLRFTIFGCKLLQEHRLKEIKENNYER